MRLCLFLLIACLFNVSQQIQQTDNSLSGLMLIAKKMHDIQTKYSSDPENDVSFFTYLKNAPPSLVQTIKNYYTPNIEKTLIQLLSLSEKEYSNALDIAQTYLTSNPQDISRLIQCLSANSTTFTALNCENTSHLAQNALNSFSKAIGGGQFFQEERKYAGRPVGYFSRPNRGVISDVSRGFFWMSTGLFFTKEIFEIFHKFDPKKSADDKFNEREKWQRIMAIFPTYTQFSRVCKHNSDFAKMVKELCTSDISFSALSDNVFENCWKNKRILVDEDMYDNFSLKNKSSFLVLRKLPKIITCYFAILVLIMGGSISEHQAGCGEISTDFLCSHQSLEGSICVLQCINRDGKIRKIDVNKPYYRYCSGGAWHPKDEPKCTEIKESEFDYGITRYTKWN
eukprot:c18156_g1_i1.p1 GENE.c18156_g1_i1~~c18156_g1_i1.p1  ORF type:complete len:413 (-),score=47.91 c18156_g1_i1:247-1437(-)